MINSLIGGFESIPFEAFGMMIPVRRFCVQEVEQKTLISDLMIMLSLMLLSYLMIWSLISYDHVTITLKRLAHVDTPYHPWRPPWECQVTCQNLEHVFERNHPLFTDCRLEICQKIIRIHLNHPKNHLIQQHSTANLGCPTVVTVRFRPCGRWHSTAAATRGLGAGRHGTQKNGATLSCVNFNRFLRWRWVCSGGF